MPRPAASLPVSSCAARPRGRQVDGWPSPEVEKDPALQIEYLEEFWCVEGVILDPAKIQRNEGRRTWGKLMANSTNKTQVTTCKDPETFFDIFLDSKRDIHRILPAGEQMIKVYHSFKEDVGKLGTNTNIFMAAFTTAHARVKMYQDGLLPLQTRVLYMDTDSVVYLATQGETHLPRGCSWPDIDEPLDRPRKLSVNNPHHIVRNVTDKTLHSMRQLKTYCMVQDKRVLDARTGRTYPYGYHPSQDIVDDMVLSVLFSDIDSPLKDWEEDLPFIPEPCHV